MRIHQRILHRLARFCDNLAADRGLLLSAPASAAETAAIRQQLAGCGPVNARPEELAGYLVEAAPRFTATLELLAGTTAPLLELGASPYLFTFLLRARGFAPQLANFFAAGRTAGSEDVRTPGGATVALAYQHFNVENERFPWPDATFGTVLCAEIIEHLTVDPVAMLAEIRRILRADGVCVLTTPNVARRANIDKLLAGGNCHDQYSGHGVYGRHNREYTIAELRALFEDNGFVIDRLFAADLETPAAGSDGTPAAGRAETRAHLFLRARRTPGPAPAVRPTWLYRSI